MAYAGQTISNSVTGENITFIETTEDTGGERLVFECRVTADGIPLRPHVHEKQEERFEVLYGTLGVMLDGDVYTLRAGDKAILPPKVKHQWWNAGDGDVCFRVEALPAGNLEAVLEANAGMAEAGKLNKKGMPKNPFHLANLGRMAETYLPGIPIWMQKPMLTMGSLTGRMFGVSPEFAPYRTLEAAPVLIEERRAA